MLFIKSGVLPLLLALALLTGCGESDNKTSDNSTEKKDNHVTQVAGKEKSVVIQCAGMTCEGCKSSIEHKVKKVDGIKTVNADFKTNIVNATFDDGKTNVQAIKDAIVSAGYKVESVKE
jgi:copper chaperone